MLLCYRAWIGATAAELQQERAPPLQGRLLALRQLPPTTAGRRSSSRTPLSPHPRLRQSRRSTPQPSSRACTAWNQLLHRAVLPHIPRVHARLTMAGLPPDNTLAYWPDYTTCQQPPELDVQQALTDKGFQYPCCMLLQAAAGGCSRRRSGGG